MTEKELGREGSSRKSRKGARVDWTLGDTVHWCCWVELLIQGGLVSGIEEKVVSFRDM